MNMKIAIAAAAASLTLALTAQTPKLVVEWDFTKGSIITTDGKIKMLPRGTTKIGSDANGKFLSIGMSKKAEGIVSQKVQPELAPEYFKIEVKFRLREQTAAHIMMPFYDNKYVNYTHPKNLPEYNKGFVFYLNREKDGSFRPYLWIGHGTTSEYEYGMPVKLEEDKVCTASVEYTKDNKVTFMIDGKVNRVGKMKTGGPVAAPHYRTVIGDRVSSSYNRFDGDIFNVKLYKLE